MPDLENPLVNRSSMEMGSNTATRGDCFTLGRAQRSLINLSEVTASVIGFVYEIVVCIKISKFVGYGFSHHIGNYAEALIDLRARMGYDMIFPRYARKLLTRGKLATHTQQNWKPI
jgi:hypothetical protein